MSELYLELPDEVASKDQLIVEKVDNSLHFICVNVKTFKLEKASIILTEASVNTLVLQLHAWLLRDKVKLFR